jgi:hypothetical protein
MFSLFFGRSLQKNKSHEISILLIVSKEKLKVQWLRYWRGTQQQRDEDYRK